MTKAERATREAVEDSIRGDSFDGTPPKELTKNQKKIFRWLYAELEPANILSRLDVPTMKNASIVLDRLDFADKNINAILADPSSENMSNYKHYQTMRKDYFAMFLRCCAELCLSPTARARMGNLALKEKAKDPLLAILDE